MADEDFDSLFDPTKKKKKKKKPTFDVDEQEKSEAKPIGNKRDPAPAEEKAEG
jgi:hypothetical protein